jgi:NAD(P)-dependent dehydrogenase (short-subunit alcohol dehydrogenase family)
LGRSSRRPKPPRSKLALERFIPRHRGQLVNIASIAGKAGAPGVATYSATKFGVVGLSEAIRQEVAGTGIDVTVVMPVGVNTELYSGLQQLRGVKTPEPEDVAEAIVEALQTGRFEVYVPRALAGILRFGVLVPRRAMEALGRVLKGDQVLAQPDRTARAAYEQRMSQTINGETTSEAAPPTATEPAETQGEREAQAVS